jgi:hypothetical protein
LLIINFSYDRSDYFNFISEINITEKYNLLDISDVLNNDKIENTLLIGSLQENEALKKVATENMIDVIGTVSLLPLNKNEQIRDINLNGLNLFWQTPISEKYPTRSFLANLFYLKAILNAKLTDFSYKKIIVILPDKNATCYKKSITLFFYKTYGVSDVVFNLQSENEKSISGLTFLKKVKLSIFETLYFKNKLKKIYLNKILKRLTII